MFIAFGWVLGVLQVSGSSETADCLGERSFLLSIIHDHEPKRFYRAKSREYAVSSHLDLTEFT